MKILKFEKIETLTQKLNTEKYLLPKVQLKGIKGGWIGEDEAEGI